MGPLYALDIKQFNTKIKIKILYSKSWLGYQTKAVINA